MRRKFIFSIGEYYHVYNRGTEKRIIFTSLNDYHRFIALLHLCNSSDPVHIGNILQNNQGQSLISLVNVEVSDRLVDIGAYCLMNNHFHLLLREKQENGISLFMKKLLTAYSMYFNKKYERNGALFEGKFKATHVDNDNYLKYLFSYIHLNPVKIIDPAWKENGIKDHGAAKIYLAGYTHSSYLDYMEASRPEGAILNKSAFPEYFGNFKEFEQFVDEWLSFKTTT